MCIYQKKKKQYKKISTNFWAHNIIGQVRHMKEILLFIKIAELTRYYGNWIAANFG